MRGAWQHDELARDLAGHLLAPDRMVWTDMQLGPSGSPRPDVYTLQKSYSKPHPMAFECKVSRSDLRSDTTSGKWQSYLKYACAVTFAVPDGLCTVADIPDACGLIVRKDAVWRYARRPTLQQVNLPFDACMKLLIDGVSRVVGPAIPRSRSVEIWRDNEAVRRKFGEAVAIAARDLHAAKESIKNYKAVANNERERVRKDVSEYSARLRKQADEEAAEWTALRREVLGFLGLKDNESVWRAQQAIQAIKASCDVDARVSAADRRVEAVRSSLEALLRSLPAPPPPCGLPAPAPISEPA